MAAIPESRGGGVKGHDFDFNKIFSKENLFRSWLEFSRGKKQKPDVARFASDLIGNLWRLHEDIIGGTYVHGGYSHFVVADQKRRDIHKASVRDRVVHHALYRALYPYFDRKFVFDSYSCRVGKGSHRAIYRFADFIRRESRNNIRTAWVLSGDIKKCFASIDHMILRAVLTRHVKCQKTINILNLVIDSFSIVRSGKGIPLGNLTSQLFVNLYLNELDQRIKRHLKFGKYIRYADDFVIISADQAELQTSLPKLEEFLNRRLDLSLRLRVRPVRTINSGIDFLGWVHFPDHRVLRRATKTRMLHNLKSGSLETAASYRGLLGHGDAYKLTKEVLG